MNFDISVGGWIFLIVMYGLGLLGIFRPESTYTGIGKAWTLTCATASFFVAIYGDAKVWLAVTLATMTMGLVFRGSLDRRYRKFGELLTAFLILLPIAYGIFLLFQYLR